MENTMKKPLLLTLLAPMILAACGATNPPPVTPAPSPSQQPPVQGQPAPNFNWVREPLALWQQQSLYDFSYWVMYDPLQLSSYVRQTYSGDNRFDVDAYSLSYSYWKSDPATSLVYSKAKQAWNEQSVSFTATEGPVGSAGIKTVHVTDQAGTKYYSIQERDLSGLPIAQGIHDGFGDGRGRPDTIKNNSATFSNGAKAYTWIMDQVDPEFSIDRVHRVFSNQYDLLPLRTCTTISTDCTSDAATIDDAIAKNAWILNGGGNVSIRLLSNSKAEVRYTGNDGTAPPNTYQISYSHVPATNSTPERLVFGDLSSGDPALTTAVTNSLNVGNGKLAVYMYGNQAVRGTFIAPQMGIRSTTYQYNKQAINDIFTKWDPEVPSVLE